MEPTLEVNDDILVFKYDFFSFKPNRDDIIVFKDPYPYRNGVLSKKKDSFNFVKRCLGISGDTIAIKGSKILNVCTNELIENVIKKFKYGTREFYLSSERYDVNINTGPLVIPYKGFMSKINIENISVYKPVIEYESKKRIIISNEIIYLDNRPLDNYIFENNYYFVVGDNVDKSIDSRSWGLLPDSHLVGRVIGKKHNWKINIL